MNDYIQTLQRLLMQLTTAEQQDVVEYYREYLEDAGVTTYQGAVDLLGTPQKVARKALADYSIKMSDRAADLGTTPTGKQGTKENVRMIWLIILALLSSPITVPIVLVLIAMVVAGAGVFFGLVAAAVGLLLAGLVGGVVVFAVGLLMLFSVPATGIFYLGLGLIMLGVSWLLTRVAIWLGSLLIRGLAQVAKWAYDRWMPQSKASHATKRGK